MTVRRRTSPGGARSTKPDGLRILVLIVVGALAITAASARILAVRRERAALLAVYPRLEQLLAVYSVLSWRSASQGDPAVRLTADYGSRDFVLECGTDGGDGAARSRPGVLFDCLAKEVLHREPVDGDTLRGPLFVPSEDLHYRFTWETLFGYELDVEVNPSPLEHAVLYQLRDSLHGPVAAACKAEVGEEAADRVCYPLVYPIAIGGLPVSRAMTFLAAASHPVFLSDGSVDRRDGWVVYLEGDATPVSAGELNRTIQLAMRQLQIADTDLRKVAPALEVMRVANDAKFVAAMIAELERAPDLTKLVSFLGGR